MTVRAFTPRQGEPPQFVAEDYTDLQGLEGDFIASEQCDGCGNSCYRVEVRMIAPGTRQYEAVCAVNPDDSELERHPQPCGNRYPIRIYDEEEVVF